MALHNMNIIVHWNRTSTSLSLETPEECYSTPWVRSWDPWKHAATLEDRSDIHKGDWEYVVPEAETKNYLIRLLWLICHWEFEELSPELQQKIILDGCSKATTNAERNRALRGDFWHITDLNRGTIFQLVSEVLEQRLNLDPNYNDSNFIPR